MYLAGVTLFGSLAAGIPLMATFFKLQPELISSSPALAYFVSASRGGSHLLIILLIAVSVIFLLWWLLIKLKFEVPLVYPLVLSLIIVFGSLSSLGVQKTMKDYQRKRLIVFINPEVDPLGSGYNIIQSKITVGSGMMLGKGLFSGTQSQLGFLPEQHTDFIFPVISEETGFVFTELTIIAYFLLIWRAMIVARESRDRYGSLVATGIAAMFAFYAFINMGMVMGITPATGLPLPLISYGGSSMVSSLWALGILFSIHIRRFTHT
jgi:rod shape determining protein RodA